MQKSITLAPGESKVVSFSVTPTVIGVHVVTVDGLSGSFTVLQPPTAQFVISDLVISPSQVFPGELVLISVTIRNVGPVAGTYTLTCEVV